MTNNANTETKFERVWKLEHDCRTADILATFGSDAAIRSRNAAWLIRVREELCAVLDTFTDEEVPAYLAWRKTQR
jgi:hypothetical protein